MQELHYLYRVLSLVGYVVALLVLFAATPSSSKKHSPHQESAESHGSSGVTPGIPIAIIYDTNTSMEIRDNIDKAIRNINNDVKFGRNKWAIKLVTIDVGSLFILFPFIAFKTSL